MQGRRYIRQGNGWKASKLSERREQMSRQIKLTSVVKLGEAKIGTRCEALEVRGQNVFRSLGSGGSTSQMCGGKRHWIYTRDGPKAISSIKSSKS